MNLYIIESLEGQRLVIDDYVLNKFVKVKNEIIEAYKKKYIISYLSRTETLRTIINFYIADEYFLNKESLIGKLDKKALMEVGESATFFGMDDIATLCAKRIIKILNEVSINESKKILFG
jgi:hypothetical protein